MKMRSLSSLLASVVPAATVPALAVPALAALLLVGLAAPPAAAGQEGSVHGRVTHAETGEPLSDVQVAVGDTDLGALSGSDGTFTVRGVPAGSWTVTASHIGYATVSREITVGGGEAVRLEIELSEEAVELGGITVIARRSGYVGGETAAGTKTSMPLVEVPQSVSLITGERMEDQGAETQAEALRYTAGVRGEISGPDLLYDWTQIRGFQQYGQNLFRDGLQLRSASQATLRLNPYGAERIEVLRGPASVLYGQSSAGGFVNYVSKMPEAEPSREVEFQTGSYDRLQGSVDLTGPVTGDGALLYRLTARARSAEAQVDFSENDQIFVAPALTWRPEDGTSLTVMGDFQSDDAVRGTSFLPAAGTVEPNPHGTIPMDRADGVPGFDGFERDQYSIGYLFEHELGDAVTLRSKARYTGMENDYQIAWGAGLREDQRTLDRFWFSGVPTLDILTVDNHGVVRFSTGALEHEVLAGVDVQRHVLDERFEMGSAPPLDVFDPEYGSQSLGDPFFSTDARREQLQAGLYFQDRIRLDRWTLLLSARRDWTDTESLDRNADATTERDSDAFTGRVGLVYRAEGGLTPYASYSESFIPLLGATESGDPFVPERGEQLEAGLKFQPPGSNAFVTLAAFDLRRQNVTTPDPDDPNFQVQTGEIRSRGVEAEGVASLAPGLDLTAAYTYLDAEVTESNAGDEGNRPIIVPEHAASLWADYTLRSGGLDGLGVAGGVRYTGSTYGNAANTLEVPAYTLVDAAVSYDWRPFRLQLNVSNVLDERYVASCWTRASCFYGTARTVRAEVEYRW